VTVMNSLLSCECGFAFTSFVGRRDDIRTVRKLLGEHRLVTLAGAGGVGKSRLAHRTAVTIRRAYRDRVWCVDLVEARDSSLLARELQDPDLLAHLVARTLDLPHPGAGTAMEALTASSAAGPMLLLLDNCEGLLPACAVMAETLLRACPQVRILSTSREPMGLDGEAVFPLAPLRTPEPAQRAGVADTDMHEAMALFVARAEAFSGFSLTEQNAPVVAELCRRLEGLPLAIELAAIRTQALTPAQMLERTEDCFALLSRGSRNAPQRQRTLRACVDWSFELCGKPEQLLWGRLSVFPGTFELDAVESVCVDESLPADELIDQVAGLVNKSVLTTERSGDSLRYRMPKTLRDYGREKLIEIGGQDELRRRHVDWYTTFVLNAAGDRFGPRQARWFETMERELPNLRAAMTAGLAEPNGADAALKLAGALWPLWAAHGPHSEGRFWLDQVLGRRAGPTIERIEALYGSCVLAAAQDDLAAVRSSARQAHEAASHLDEGAARGLAACADGVLATAHGNLVEAVGCWRRAVDELRAGETAGGPATLWHAVALDGLGLAAARLGDADTAARCHEEIVATCPPDGDSLFSGLSLGSLGLALWKHGDPKTAAVRLREALMRLRRIDHVLGVAWCLEVLAWIAGDEERAERAATLLGAATGLRHTAVPHPAAPEPLPAHHPGQRIKAALGEPAYRAAFGRGEVMSVDDAIAYGLDEHGRPQPPPRQPAPTQLTRREEQVAELVAQGLRNKEIAAALVISRRTAESHVENILTKLGLWNRAQVAAWVTHRTAARLD